MKRLSPVLGIVLCAASASAAPVINGINDRDTTLGTHFFELYGSFPSFDVLAPLVTCNGARLATEIVPTTLCHHTPNEDCQQINIFVASMPSNSTCTFRLRDIVSGSLSNIVTLTPHPPTLEILGVNDRGVTSGRRYLELYGNFGTSHGSLEPRVVCQGLYAYARSEWSSSGQINISYPEAGAATKCTIALRRLTDGLETPRWGALPVPDTKPVAGFGAYHWGGTYTRGTDTLGFGQSKLNAARFDSTRVVMDPVMRSGSYMDNWYNLDLTALDQPGTGCPQAVPFLPCAVTLPSYQAVFSGSNLTTIVINAYDSATRGPRGQSAEFVNLDFFTNSANRERVRQEYEDMTYNLFESYSGSGKSFIIASWEGDNQAYCGSFYRYANDASFRRQCGNVASRQYALDAMRAWFLARHDGIIAGRARAAGRFNGMEVLDGVEFNINSLVKTHYVLEGFSLIELPTVLQSIVPWVRPDVTLYSSYDTQYRGKMDAELAGLKSHLLPYGSELAIGEIGFTRHAVEPVDIFRTVEIVKATQRAALRTTILWEAFDTRAGDRSQNQDRITPYGVLGLAGQQRSVMQILRKELAQQWIDMLTGSPASISSVSDLSVSLGYRTFKLLGTFPGGTFSVLALCDGTDAKPTVTSQSTRQITFKIPHRSVERFCSFRARRGDGIKTLSYGPVIAGP